MKFSTEDGILTIVWNSSAHTSNVLDDEACEGLEHALQAVASESVRGVILTTGKQDFSTGDALSSLVPLLGPDVDVQRQMAHVLRVQRLLTRLEECGKPVVAAVRGDALGVGFELALACLRRIGSEGARFALPQVKAGLMPSAGGTQRLPRLLGIEAALPYVAQGRTLSAEEALDLGVLHALVPLKDLEQAALAALRDDCPCSPPWGQRGFRLPDGGVHSTKGAQLFSAANALTHAKTFGNLPAPQAILSAMYEGLPRRLDDALTIEARHAVALMREPASGNLLRATLLASRNDAVRKGASHPDAPSKVAVIGGGMMGAGIAQVSAAAGVEVTLIEHNQDAADRALERIEARLNRAVERGHLGVDKATVTLGRIRATAEYAELSDVELVIEAVFEDREIKARVTREAEASVSPTAVFASNTSTLPITGLALASARPKNFIGLHFFSPVDRMPLVEVIVGEQTSEATLKRALSYVLAIGKTPIVVKDSRGFYTSRVFSTYVMEGLAMLADGVKPALIENAGRLSGMPMPPLALADEVSIGLLHRIRRQTREDLGADWVTRPGDAVIEEMVESHQRPGRAAGAGFYDYEPEKRLWPGLSANWPEADIQPDVEELRDRLLAIQAVEALRCLDEGILECAEDADVGALLGWGFAPWTGGPIRYVKTIGTTTFARLCQRLCETHGSRFATPMQIDELVNT
jgi:3-hydroxyacyl-CoA dehydrogenase/enoyl-CoA hydratase/3-hydroxybutyryl-CoA epimerase